MYSSELITGSLKDLFMDVISSISLSVNDNFYNMPGGALPIFSYAIAAYDNNDVYDNDCVDHDDIYIYDNDCIDHDEPIGSNLEVCNSSVYEVVADGAITLESREIGTQFYDEGVDHELEELNH